MTVGVSPRAAVLCASLAAAAVGGRQLAPAVWRSRRLRLAWRPMLAGLGAPGHVALTFDDGPHPEATPLVLEILRRYEVTASFFVLGEQLVRYPEIAARVHRAGHELAVHGWGHANLARVSPARARDDLARAWGELAAVTGSGPRWFRPPYGVLTGSAVRTAELLGMTPVLWTTWGRDWRAEATSASVFADVTARLQSGGTVLLHDSDVTAAPRCWEATVGALPSLLEYCRERGWQVGPLDRHALPATSVPSGIADPA